MSQPENEYFGSPAQQGLERRAHDVWLAMKDDKRVSSHGRAVGLTDHVSGTVELQAALARLQGVCPVDGAPSEIVPERISALEAEGFKTDCYVSWRSSETTLEAARRTVSDRNLPSDLKVRTIGPDTPGEDLTALDKLTQSCDVLLPMGAFLRGIERPAVVLAAFDAQGQAVGAAASVAQNHPDHAKASLAYWGMLATAPDRRGQGIALVLGAQALVDMNDRFGNDQFATGIRQGNEPSEALCAKLDFGPSDYIDVMAIYPPAFGDGQMTK